MHALPRQRAAHLRGGFLRGAPARSGRRGPALALLRGPRAEPRRRGRATRSRSPCRPRSRAATTAPVCARSAARTSTRTPITRTRRRRTSAGRSCPNSSSTGASPRGLRRARGRYPFAPSWQSLSKSNRTRAPRSVGRSTRSLRPRSTTARSAAGLAARTACARIAGSTAVARSCTCTTRTITITSTSSTPVTVAVDVNGADLGPAEVARGAAHAEGVRVILFGPAAEIGPVPVARLGGGRSGVDRQGGRSRPGRAPHA